MALTKIRDAGMPAGAVLQVVSNVIANDQVNTNSQSFVDATLNCAITPTSSSSKVLVMVNSQQKTSSSGDYGLFGLKRGSTDLESGKLMGAQQNDDWETLSFQYLDSPSTTSATTYTLRFASNAGSNYVYVGWQSSGVQSMILMEIAG
tara:strand:+ start:203 stop:646 length:444 start_codon:yes stop_codon:yes gene_type:complete